MFLKFVVMPFHENNRPEFVESGRPPASQVDEHWHYDPCPSNVKGFGISSSFIQTLLDPGHADAKSKEWFRLLPKKVGTRFDEGQGGGCLACGLQIKEGQNHFAIILAWLLSFFFSGVIGIICAKAIDPGTGFTIAAWVAVMTGLALSCLQVLPP